MERERRRERIKSTCEYEREGCLKGCQKVVIQISFLLFNGLNIFFVPIKSGSFKISTYLILIAFLFPTK